MSNPTDNKPRPIGSGRNFGHMLPGILSWAMVALAIAGTIFFPQAWLAIATAFFAYFICRSTVTAVFALIGENKIKQWQRRDWTFGEDAKGPHGFAPSEVRHVVIVPNYKEPDDILRRTLDALAGQHRANERMIVVLGMEEREPGAQEKGNMLAAEYAGRFMHTLVTVHPGGIIGEEPGKSSNEAWAAKLARVELDRIGVDPELTTITSCDADSVIDTKYFSAVAKSFAAHERRHLSFWQAPLLYYNNIWDVPAPIRVTTWLSHAVQISDLAMPFFHPLPISTYTLSLQLAERCGWWDPAIIPEDWHEYLNCLFETGEEITTESIFLPTMADATDGDGWLQALTNRFHQVKRHSWGAEDVGYIVGQFAERADAVRKSTLMRFVQVLADHVLRVGAFFFLISIYILTFYYTRIPWYSIDFHAAILQNLRVLRVLFVIGAVVMIAMVAFELWRCPPPKRVSRVKLVIELLLLWFALPIFGFYLGALPALSAQTRLMLGVPLGYRLTPKRFVEAAPVKLAGTSNSES
ncbi:MAG: hypothetical protein HGA39_02655 [Coriobacteriia bacterium]|nr:hypothetical protein [Coriobacteriia bacterium]